MAAAVPGTHYILCTFSPDGKYVASSLDVDHGIYITDSKDATTMSHIRDHHKKTVTACCFDHDSQKVASILLDKSIKIWDITSQATVLTITQAHSNAISNCCFTFSGHFLCSSSWDKNLKNINVHTGEFRNRGACVTLMQGHESSVSSCHFARDTSFLVSGGFDKTVAIWDVGEGYRKLSLKAHTALPTPSVFTVQIPANDLAGNPFRDCCLPVLRLLGVGKAIRHGTAQAAPAASYTRCWEVRAGEQEAGKTNLPSTHAAVQPSKEIHSAVDTAANPKRRA
ncbi:LOW QUALITY PROTEIN: WD repeat-containing protein 88-like [Glossophaga mutica]